jgi:hypothetical protein
MSIKRNKKYFLKMDPDVPSPLPATVLRIHKNQTHLKLKRNRRK